MRACLLASLLVACNLDSNISSELPDSPSPVDARLVSLVPSKGVLTPSFDPDVVDYQLDLRLVDESVDLTVDAIDPAGTIVVADQGTPDGGTASVTLGLGANSIRVTVVASDQSDTRTYTVDVGRGRGITQEAYVKASNPSNDDRFGGNQALGTVGVAISGDTLAVGAAFEDSDGVGVGGTQGNDARVDSGAVYVFRRQPNDRWLQEAFIKPTNPDAGDLFGISVALDGDTLVVGALLEAGNGSSPADNSLGDSGAAYVFRRTGTVWVQEGYLKASNREAGDRFGGAVAVSGSTLVVSAFGEDSASGTNPADNTRQNSGAAYVFVKNGSAWTEQAYIKAPNADVEDLFGVSVALSGNTLAVGTHQEDSNASGVGGSEANDSLADSGAVFVFVRSGTTWTKQAYIKATSPDAGDNFGNAIALSGDTLAIGSRFDDASPGTTPNPNDDSAAQSGAVYTYKRSGTTWSSEAFVKSNANHGAEVFGFSVALVDDVLAVGAPSSDTSKGSAYLFTRTGGLWVEQRRITAANADSDDLFGFSVGVSTSGLVAVGAINEDSASPGIDGDAGNNVASDSGAAYVFR